MYSQGETWGMLVNLGRYLDKESVIFKLIHGFLNT